MWGWNNSLTIEWYEGIPGIPGSDMVYIFFGDNPPQFQIHNQIVHGSILMNQISVTAERHTSAENKSPSPSEVLHGNNLQCKLNGRKEFDNTIAKEVVF